MTITVTIDGNAVSYTETPAEAAGLTAAWDKVMQALPVGEGQAAETPVAERPGYVATEQAWLEALIADHYARTSEPPAETLARCLVSWSGVDAPAQPAEPAPLDLRSYAVDKRWRVEVGGVVVNGVTIPTDDRSKLLLLGAAQSMADGSSAPLVINGTNYGTFSKAQFQAINSAVVAHVQATFANLATALAGIDGGSITTQAHVDAVF